MAYVPDDPTIHRLHDVDVGTQRIRPVDIARIGLRQRNGQRRCAVVPDFDIVVGWIDGLDDPAERTLLSRSNHSTCMSIPSNPFPADTTTARLSTVNIESIALSQSLVPSCGPLYPP